MPAKLSHAEAISRLQAKFPHLDFSNTKYAGSSLPLSFVCPTHGEQTKSRFYALLDSDYGCPTCGDEHKTIIRFSNEDWLVRLQSAQPTYSFSFDIKPEELTHLAKTTLCNRFVRVTCTKGHTWLAVCSAITNQGTGCKRCNGGRNKAFLQQIIKKRWENYRASKAQTPQNT